MRADVHMHCGFSNDSETRPEDMVENAIAKGLSVICFTDLTIKIIWTGAMKQYSMWNRIFRK